MPPIASSRTRPDRRGRAIVIAATGALTLGLLGGCAADEGPTNVTVNDAQDPSQFGITVSGVGQVEGAPDTLILTMGVSVKRPTVAEALDQAAVSSDAVLAALREGGAADEDLQTRRYTIDQEFRTEGDAQVPDGFRVTNTVEARLRDLDTAGDVIDDAVRAGGDDVRLQGIGFDLEEDTELLAEARTEAYEDALARAERLAELSGQTLGPAEYVSEGSNPFTTEVFQEVGSAISGDGAPADIAIEPGSVEGTVQVVIRFPLVES